MTQAQLDAIDKEVAAEIEASVGMRSPQRSRRRRPDDGRLRKLSLNDERQHKGEQDMARELTFKDAINEALAQEMARDETVIAMGEDNVGGMGADGDRCLGWSTWVTKGLHAQVGDRIMDTPITESAFIGAAAGAAACGCVRWQS